MRADMDQRNLKKYLFAVTFRIFRRLIYVTNTKRGERRVDYEKLYEAYYMQVYSYALTLTKNRTDAEDIAQIAFYKAMRTKGEYRGEAGELTWLCSIARNAFLDRKRKEGRERGEPLFDTDLPSDDYAKMEEALSDGDEAFRIHTVLHGLPEPYKEVFTLRIFGELPYETIGRLFGKSENWARVTYHRARIKIRERMGGADE